MIVAKQVKTITIDSHYIGLFSRVAFAAYFFRAIVIYRVVCHKTRTKFTAVVRRYKNWHFLKTISE